MQFMKQVLPRLSSPTRPLTPTDCSSDPLSPPGGGLKLVDRGDTVHVGFLLKIEEEEVPPSNPPSSPLKYSGLSRCAAAERVLDDSSSNMTPPFFGEAGGRSAGGGGGGGEGGGTRGIQVLLAPIEPTPATEGQTKNCSKNCSKNDKKYQKENFF